MVLSNKSNSSLVEMCSIWRRVPCFLANWDFGVYWRKYGDTRELADHPQFKKDCWLWRRRVSFGRYNDQDISCCPEDIQCDQEHAATLLCPECTFPICNRCLRTSSLGEEKAMTIPASLANDIFSGFALDIVYKQKKSKRETKKIKKCRKQEM